MITAPLVRPRPTLDAWEWQEQGLCRGMDSERFFTEDRDHGQQRRASRNPRGQGAVRPVPCRAGLPRARAGRPETYGIWGGATASERLQMLAAARAEPPDHRTRPARTTAAGGTTPMRPARGGGRHGVRGQCTG